MTARVINPTTTRYQGKYHGNYSVIKILQAIKNPEITVLHKFFGQTKCSQDHPQFGIFAGVYTAGP